MGSDGTARALTIAGIVFNIIAVVLSFISLLALLSLVGLMDPFWDPSGMMYSLVTALVTTTLVSAGVTFVFGLILPIVGYVKVKPESKGTAAALLIVSGVISLIFSGIIGGILLIIAGALAASWKPFPEEGYPPVPTKSLGPPPPFAAQPSIAPAAKSVTPKGAKYCVACGAELQGDERFCPICGTTIG